MRKKYTNSDLLNIDWLIELSSPERLKKDIAKFKKTFKGNDAVYQQFRKQALFFGARLNREFKKVRKSMML